MRSRVTTVLALAAGLALGATATAFAVIPGADGKISGCYDLKSGELRVVDGSAKCKSTEASITWNQAGPVGPRGPVGPAGATGPAGPAGPVRDFDDVVGSTCRGGTPFEGRVSVQYNPYQIFGNGDHEYPEINLQCVPTRTAPVVFKAVFKDPASTTFVELSNQYFEDDQLASYRSSLGLSANAPTQQLALLEGVAVHYALRVEAGDPWTVTGLCQGSAPSGTTIPTPLTCDPVPPGGGEVVVTIG